MQASRELKRALTRHLRVQPIDAEQAYRELLDTNAYVKLMEDRLLLREDPVDVLFETIDLHPAMPTVQLLSGFRGTGKTTALLRLRDRLEAAEFAAIRIDVRQYLSTEEPPGIEEFLLFLAAAALTEAKDQDLIAPERVATLLSRAKDWIKRIEVKGATVELGNDHGKVSVELGLADPDRLSGLRRTIAGNTRKFAGDIHADLKELREAVAKHRGGRELVLIVDSVEQYRGTLGEGGTAIGIQQATERLFSANADLLDPNVAGLHLVYTVPPYLRALVPGLGNRFEPGGLRLVPAVKVRDRDGERFAPGIDRLVELVRLRIAAALAELGDDAPASPWDVIPKTACETLVIETGGVVRELVRAVQGVVTRLDWLPVPDEVVELSLSRIREEYELNDQDAAVLALVEPTSPPPIADQGEGVALWARQLDVGNALCYENGEAWYAVNPLIADRLTRQMERLSTAAKVVKEPSEGDD